MLGEHLPGCREGALTPLDVPQYDSAAVPSVSDLKNKLVRALELGAASRRGRTERNGNYLGLDSFVLAVLPLDRPLLRLTLRIVLVVHSARASGAAPGGRARQGACLRASCSRRGAGRGEEAAEAGGGRGSDAAEGGERGGGGGGGGRGGAAVAFRRAPGEQRAERLGAGGRHANGSVHSVGAGSFAASVVRERKYNVGRAFEGFRPAEGIMGRLGLYTQELRRAHLCMA